jgi:MFS family permease
MAGGGEAMAIDSAELEAALPTFMESIRALPRTFWITALGAMLLALAGYTFVFLAYYVRDLGYSKATAGAVVSVSFAGALTASLIGGQLADRLGRNRTIVIGAGLAGAFTILLSQVHSVEAIMIVAYLQATMGWSCYTATRALAADLVPKKHQLAGFAVLRFGLNIGFGFGSVIGAVTSSRSFQTLFIASATMFFVLGVIAMIFFPRGRVVTAHEKGGRGLFKTAMGDRKFVVFLVSQFIACLVYVQAFSGLALQFGDYGYSPETYGLMIAVFNGFLIVFAELPISAVVNRHSRIGAIALGSVLIGFGLMLTAFSGSIVWLAITIIIWTIGEMVATPSANAYTAEVSPPHMRGRYAGLHGVSEFGAWAVGPVIGGLLLTWSSNGLWIFCALAGVFSAVLLLFGSRAREPHVEVHEVAASPAEVE